MRRGADVKHDGVGRDDAAERGLVEIVARVVVHHRVVPVVRRLDQLVWLVTQSQRHDKMWLEVLAKVGLCRSDAITSGL